MPLSVAKQIERLQSALDQTCAEMAATLEQKRPLDRKLDALAMRAKHQRDAINRLIVTEITKGK